MAGPSPAFLAQLNAGLGNDPFAAGAQAAGIAPPAPAMPVSTTTPYGASSVAGPPIVLPGVQPASQQAPAGPPPPPPEQVGGPLPAQAVPAEPMANDVQFRPVGGGVTPAREVETRGPQQKALLEASFQPGMEAADRMQLRSGIESAHAADVYETQAEQFQQQAEAMQRVQERRAFELQQMRAKYDNTIEQLGKAKIDDNRLWANMSTGDKIGATILLMISSAVMGPEKALKLLDDRIKADVDQQVFDYHKGLDTAKAQQTAYGLALEQYQSEDAAYHAAMASGQLAAANKVSALQAQWKGAQEANQADMLRAELIGKAKQTAADGFKFLQPTAAAPKYQMMVRGQPVPGLVDERRAQDIALEHGVKPSEKVDQTLVEGGVQATLQERKLAAEQAKATKAFQVVLPNGETLSAPSEKDKEKVQTLSAAVSNAQDLVREAKQLRSGTAWLVPGSKERQRLESIQSELTLSFKDRGGLGALSGPDMDLAMGATGEITSRLPNADAKLDSFVAHTNGALRNYVKTIPGAPPKSSGVMPGSFQAAK